ncbi:ribonucleoside-triphosphate reductase activating protein [Bacillus sp. FJAT-27225]|uniref:4Fe-4S single cluster domain-containing protein n=1 Tax=Bacillus sp. FJAT-27225 TaxID=1743144 RepID=UPI00080C30D5|nr:4Fe-4S single cluster domain-containing protein [Bacillus sp. FJAT-27225]OCA87831.1 ribonucleoside-triphosphate reductase activating protein [Bacillus sp. FJAT-27225]
MKLCIHQFIPFTRVEGPGDRACIQVQGCPIHCPGCAVPFTWSKQGGYDIDVEELYSLIIEGPKVEGVTFLGGEPFEQAAALAELGSKLKSSGYSIMTFSGYYYQDIKAANRDDWNHLLSVTDILCDGPFVREQRDLSRPWIGSANQHIRFLTDRYKHLEGELKNTPNRLEISIKPDGRVLANGLASVESMEALFKNLIK